MLPSRNIALQSRRVRADPLSVMLPGRDKIAASAGAIRLSRVTEVAVGRGEAERHVTGAPPLKHLSALLREMRSVGGPLAHLAPQPEQAATRLAA